MRLLVVLPRPPDPEGGAADRCSLGLLRGLVSHGVEVSAVAAVPPDWPYRQMPGDLDVELVPVEDGDDLLTRLHRLRRPVVTLARGAFARRVRELARGAEVVHLETIETAWCDAGIDVPSTLHLHYLTRLDRDLGFPGRRDSLRALEYARAERAAARRHPELVASSPVVAAALARLGGAHVTETRLALDPGAYAAGDPPNAPVAGMIGTAAWEPTRRALERLAGEVWPRVLARVPAARLLLAGRGLEGLPALRGPSIEALGEVPSAAEFLRGLAVLVFPLERGSGMKVKVLESLALGVPVVTTPAGAEGVFPTDGVVVEEDPVRLADAAATLLADPEGRRRRAAAARAAFLRHYAPGPATLPLVRLHERLAAGRSPRGAR